MFEIKKLERGCTFFFKNKEWKVTKVYNAEWGDGIESKKFKIKSDDGTIRFLTMETHKNEITNLSFWQMVTENYNAISGVQISGGIHNREAVFSKIISHKGVDYEFVGVAEGTYFYFLENEEVVSLDYSDESDTRLLNIEQGKIDTVIYTGFYVEENEITRIKKSRIANSAALNYINKNFLFIVISVFIIMVFLITSYLNQ